MMVVLVIADVYVIGLQHTLVQQSEIKEYFLLSG